MTKNSGLADSPFFAVQAQTATPPPLNTGSEPQAAILHPYNRDPSRDVKKRQKRKLAQKKALIPSNRDTTTPRHHATVTPRLRDTTTPSYHDDIVELVRKAVKEFGKEAATHRFTIEEKKAIADMLYTYKAQGVKTSENEIARIAINFIVQDYRENGAGSILDKVLRALNK